MPVDLSVSPLDCCFISLSSLRIKPDLSYCSTESSSGSMSASFLKSGGAACELAKKFRFYSGFRQTNMHRLKVRVSLVSVFLSEVHEINCAQIMHFLLLLFK